MLEMKTLEELGPFKPALCIDGHPAPTNGMRAERAMGAVKKWLGTDKPDETPETHIKDLISDLCHLMHREGIEVDETVAGAYDCFLDEATATEDCCSKCGALTDDGEGFDGLCGNCADKKEGV